MYLKVSINALKVQSEQYTIQIHISGDLLKNHSTQ